MHHIWRNSLLRIGVKNFEQNLLENYSKRTEITIMAGKFSNFFLGKMPPYPPNIFLFLHQLQICSDEKKYD